VAFTEGVQTRGKKEKKEKKGKSTVTRWIVRFFFLLNFRSASEQSRGKEIRKREGGGKKKEGASMIHGARRGSGT